MQKEQIEFRLQRNAARVEGFLRSFFEEMSLESIQDVAPLTEAMNYSIMAGGKRIRPSLVIEACLAMGGEMEAAIPFAAALEMIHTYSLIHDDLPCMDDDDMRRGMPSNHKVYGYANALLAGDALLTEAFGVLTRAVSKGVPAEQVVMATALLSKAAGMDGMVGGQVMDLRTDNEEVSFETLISIQSRKTGELISAAVELGMLAAGCSLEDQAFMSYLDYAHDLGLAFQIVDDILDVEGDPVVLGKTTGKDQASGKKTFVSFVSIEEAKAIAEDLSNRAAESVQHFDPDGFFAGLATYLLQRKK